jgi:two-component system chemotaxis response regulator CheY
LGVSVPLSPAEYLDLSAITVLVLDDNANMRNLIAEVVRCLGVRKVVRAESAAVGRTILQSGGVDLVLADIEMAGENGLEFVRQVRANANPAIAEVVIVMVSAHATESRVIGAGAAGANSFLVKPFSVTGFARRVAEGFAHRYALMQAEAARSAATGQRAIEL